MGWNLSKKYRWWYDGVEIYPQNIDGVTLRVENLQVKLCDVYVGMPTKDLAHHCAGISQCVDFKNCQLHFPCVYSRESAAAMTCTQTKPEPDSMLPRYYVASCIMNMGWLRSYRQLCSGLPSSQTCSDLHRILPNNEESHEELRGCPRSYATPCQGPDAV